MTTYAELTQQILDYTETDDTVLTSTITNDFIEHTENKIMRDADLPVFRTYEYTQFTASTPFLTLPGGSSITPVDFSVIRSVMIYADGASATSTGDRTYLESKDITFMNEYWPNRNTEGTPKYYSLWDQNSIYVVPTPSSALFCEVGLTRMPPRLSSTTTQTWLSRNAPALMLYGALVEAFRFLKGPAEMLQTYQQSYQLALRELAAEQQGRSRRDEYQHGVLRIPEPSFDPQLGSIKPMGGSTAGGGQ